MARPKGTGRIIDTRAKMLARIAADFPDFDPVSRMIEAAELARDDVLERKKAFDDYKASGEASPEELQTMKVQTGELNALSQMYERPARFLIPQLKAHEVKAGGMDGGPITVVFGNTE